MTEKTFRECGPGWEDLIAPVEALIHSLGGEVRQIKEKFAGLRLYYTSGDKFDDPRWDDVERMVQDAERESQKRCEMCGQTGAIRTNGGWIKTLCNEHAIEFGYHYKT